MRRIAPRLELALALALLPLLGGCMATRSSAPPAPLPPAAQNQPAMPGGANPPASAPPAHWWQALGDAQLAGLIDTGLAHATAQPGLSAEIARQFIDLRAQQTTLVLLARREDLDAQLVAMARHSREETAARPALQAAQARQAATWAEQARVRADITARRQQLAVLAGMAPDALDTMPGGPVPLPPANAAAEDSAGILARQFTAARAAEAMALSQADHARAAAAQELSAQAGTLPPGEGIAADLQALDASQAEEQARAAMTLAWVALARSLDREAGR